MTLQTLSSFRTLEVSAASLVVTSVEAVSHAESVVVGAVAMSVAELASVIHTDENTKDQPDGNNVDSDTQSALFAKNALQYQALINQINAEFTMMRTAMRKS